MHSTCYTGTCTKEFRYFVKGVDHMVIYCSNYLQGWGSKARVTLVRDLTDALGPSIKVLLKNSDFQSEILGWEVPSLMEQLRGTAFWVQGMISPVLVSWGKAAPIADGPMSGHLSHFSNSSWFSTIFVLPNAYISCWVGEWSNAM
jgi:hypothetical protein